ncbi:MAG: serine/threonine protein kinase [Bacteroidales bacterium]|nr:serine/threonine protein kinase [Bacteroidales bacterium]
MANENESIGGYRLRKLLHTAQHTQVFEVVEPRSNRHFAMKVLLPESASDEDQREMLFHEAEVGKKMEHENVVKIVKVSKDAKAPHIVMEYFPAGSLRARLQSRDPKDKQFLFEQMKNIMRQVATGLAYMNTSGWLHRDVKPDNILADSLGQCKIIDFAIAKPTKTGFFEKLMHKKGKPQGTPSFMSPEQIRDEIIDTRADIYSYGATIYELVCGRPPFRGTNVADLLSKQLTAKVDTPQVYNPEVTDDFSAFLLKTLAKDRKDRFQNFHEILMALRELRVYKVTAYKKSQPEE